MWSDASCGPSRRGKSVELPAALDDDTWRCFSVDSRATLRRSTVAWSTRAHAIRYGNPCRRRLGPTKHEEARRAFRRGFQILERRPAPPSGKAFAEHSETGPRSSSRISGRVDSLQTAWRNQRAKSKLRMRGGSS